MEKVKIVCLGFQSRTAGLLAQANPMLFNLSFVKFNKKSPYLQTYFRYQRAKK